MPENDPDKDEIYMICPFCRRIARTAWTDRELSDFMGKHIKRQECRK